MAKKHVLIYDSEKMKLAGQYLNAITVSGVDNIRRFAEISYILDSGEPAEVEEETDGNLK